MVRVHGIVQGVCFRYATQQEAIRLGISGWVRNVSDGSVEACIVGDAEQIATMRQWLHHGPTHARVTQVEFHPAALPEALIGFTIRH